jgi:hypothetical protein
MKPSPPRPSRCFAVASEDNKSTPPQAPRPTPDDAASRMPTFILGKCYGGDLAATHFLLHARHLLNELLCVCSRVSVVLLVGA